MLKKNVITHWASNQKLCVTLPRKLSLTTFILFSCTYLLKIHLFLISFVPEEKFGLMRGQDSNVSTSSTAQLSTVSVLRDGKKSPNRLSRISTWSAAHLHSCTEFHQPAEMTRFFLHRVSGALSVSKAVVLGQLGIILMLQARDSLNKLQGLWCRLLPVHIGIKSSVFGTKSFFMSDREKLTAPVQATSLLCYNEVNRSPRSLIDNSLRYKQASLRFLCAELTRLNIQLHF